MSLLKRFRKRETVEPEKVSTPVPQVVTRAKGFVPPPPRQKPPASSDPRAERLLRRIEALEEEIELVERSADPDSPFQQRIAVLSSALDAIEREIASATTLPTRELPSLPPIPIANVSVTLEPVPQVSFSIESHRFTYTEEIDWAERGTQIVRGDLVGTDIETGPLIPSEITGPLREELSAHLERSLFAFATDLRDRAIEGSPLPVDVTLADLAVPSPACGDWELWGGVSLHCLEHEARLRDLNAERSRLLDERGAEIEERQRQVEELPIQRRRLAQAIADLRALESQS
jgi:hypothetical protein